MTSFFKREQSHFYKLSKIPSNFRQNPHLSLFKSLSAFKHDLAFKSGKVTDPYAQMLMITSQQFIDNIKHYVSALTMKQRTKNLIYLYKLNQLIKACHKICFSSPSYYQHRALLQYNKQLITFGKHHRKQKPISSQLDKVRASSYLLICQNPHIEFYRVNAQVKNLLQEQLANNQLSKKEKKRLKYCLEQITKAKKYIQKTPPSKRCNHLIFSYMDMLHSAQKFARTLNTKYYKSFIAQNKRAKELKPITKRKKIVIGLSILVISIGLSCLFVFIVIPEIIALISSAELLFSELIADMNQLIAEGEGLYNQISEQSFDLEFDVDEDMVLENIEDHVYG